MAFNQKILTIFGILALLASLALSVGFKPPGVVMERVPQAGYDQARPPVQFGSVAEPVGQIGPHRGGTTTSVVYTPANIQNAYNFGTFANGSGKAIAIVDAYGDPTLTKDLTAFDTKFGLPAATVNVFYPDGAPAGSNSGWAVETALDVEWAHANAPNATIDLVIVPSPTFQQLLDGINYGANSLSVVAISMSFGAPLSQVSASTITSYETAFSNATAKGVLLFAASGDSGAYDGTSQLTTDYPASSPKVIGVGGTTLKLNTSGGYGSETAWNGSGGGYASAFSEPSFQTTAVITDTSAKRGVPDVGFDANPNTGVYVVANGVWYVVGGTSVGAPNWAAIAADSAAAGGHQLTLSYIYGTVYGVGGSAALYKTEIHDVTSGNNGYYTATTGWDPVTGIGSPNVANLIQGK